MPSLYRFSCEGALGMSFPEESVSANASKSAVGRDGMERSCGMWDVPAEAHKGHKGKHCSTEGHMGAQRGTWWHRASCLCLTLAGRGGTQQGPAES